MAAVRPGQAWECTFFNVDLRALASEPSSWTTPDFPFVLSVGERRALTANTIIRDPSWRRRDARGALRIDPEDAEQLDVEMGGSLRGS